MRTSFIHSVRDTLLSKKALEQRRDTLSHAKAIRTAASAIGLVSVGFAILDAHEGRYFRALSFLPLAYASYETGALAENARDILENPAKEFRAVCSKIHSDEEFWRFLTTGAPLSRKIGLSYIKYKAVPPGPSLWSRMTSRMTSGTTTKK